MEAGSQGRTGIGHSMEREGCCITQHGDGCAQSSFKNIYVITENRTPVCQLTTSPVSQGLSCLRHTKPWSNPSLNTATTCSTQQLEISVVAPATPHPHLGGERSRSIEISKMHQVSQQRQVHEATQVMIFTETHSSGKSKFNLFKLPLGTKGAVM